MRKYQINNNDQRDRNQQSRFIMDVQRQHLRLTSREVPGALFAFKNALELQ